MFCYLNEAFTVWLKSSSILKRLGREGKLSSFLFCFVYFIIHMLFLRKLVHVIHPRVQIQSFLCTQFKQFEKESTCAFKKYICIHIKMKVSAREQKMEGLSLYSL